MRFIYLIVALVALSSCGNKRIYEQDIEIEDENWTYSDSLEFTFEVKDTVKLYGLGMTVEFTEDYPYENIYTNIKTILPDNEVKEALFSVELRKINKRRSMKCKDDVCTVDVFLQAPLKFVEEGKYSLHIFQHSRDEELPGLRKIGLYLEELKSEFK